MIPFTFVMQNLAANLGGMVLPFGNPQNLYLFERFDIPLVDFLAVMALPFALSVALIALCCVAFVREGGPGKAHGLQKHASGCESAQVKSGEDERGVGAWEASASPGAKGVRGEDAGGERREGAAGRLACGTAAARAVAPAVYVALLLLVVGSVLRLVLWWASAAVVVGVLAVLDRKALRQVDWGLLLTFACFFVFAGNMARIPAVEGLLAQGMEGSVLMVSAATSQVISNVPAAVLLSHFTGSWQALLVGVNVGGAGTLVASLASLITFSHFRIVRKSFPTRPGLAACTTRRFVAIFSAFNYAFLAVLLAASAILLG